MTSCRTLAWSLIVIGLFAATAEAQRYQVESVLPRTVQRGTRADIVIGGVFLEDPRELVFYRPGIRCTAVGPVTEIIDEQGKVLQLGLAHGGKIVEQIRCRIEIAEDCPLGEHPFHVRRGAAITVLGTINVTPLKCVDEYEHILHSNDVRERAVEIPLNATVRGTIRQLEAQDVDLYKIRVNAGQRLAVEVDMAQISDRHVGASEVDVAVRILDANGKELAAADDSGLHVQDPVFNVKFVEAGFAYVEVKQSTFTPIGTAEFNLGGIPYALHLGTFRRPLALYPAGGPIGAPLTVRQLDDVSLGRETKTIDVTAEPGFFEYYGDAPSPLRLRASDFPNVLEQEEKPVSGRRVAPAATNEVAALPAALNGIIAQPGEADRFRFRVTKGERWHVRTFASALGTPLDPIVRLRPIAADGMPGEVEAEFDDATLTERDIVGHYPRSGGGMKDVLDPSFVWTPKQDGLYELEIADTTGGGSPLAVYRIEVQPASDGLAVVLYNHGVAVPRGGRRAVRFRVDAMQGNTYAGPIQVTAKNLPPGVTFRSPPIPAGTPLPVIFWPGLLECSSTADAAAGFFTLEAQSVSPAPPVRTTFQWKAPFINQTGGDSFHIVAMDRTALVVADPPPVELEVSPPSTALVCNGELAVPIRIRRRPGFNEPVTIDALWLPTGVGKAAALELAPDQSEAVLKISAAANAKLGTWPLPIIATSQLSPTSGPIEFAGSMVDLVVAEPFVELAAGLESIRRGERKRYVWTVTPSDAFAGSAAVRLLGLPKGVTQIGTPTTITKESREIAFEIEATDDALLGPVGGVMCEVVLTSGGQEIRQLSGNAVLRIDPKLSTSRP